MMCFVLASIPVCQANFVPQVTVTDVQKKDVIDAMVAHMMKNGWSVKNINEYTVSFVQGKSNFWASVFTGSNSFEFRTNFNFLQTGEDVLVTAYGESVSFPGTSHEQINPADNGVNEKIQGMLTGMNYAFNGGYFYGFNAKKEDDCILVDGITPGSAFANAGIKNKDKILSINGKQIADMNKEECKSSLDAMKANFLIEHNGTAKTYVIEKTFVPPTIKKTHKLAEPAAPAKAEGAAQ